MELKASFPFEPLPENVRADIHRKYLSWERFRQPFTIEHPKGNRLDQTRFVQDIGEMAQNCDIGVPRKISSHRRLLGPFIIWTKETLMRVARPVIHICLSRQIVFNDYTLALAQRVAFLEDRIRKLELALESQKPESERGRP